MKSFIIQTPKGTRTIGAGHPCFIVAEMSGNHNGTYERAEEIIRIAAAAGADAIKLQCYTPDTITMDSKKPWFMENNGENPSVWQGKSMYEMFQGAFTPFEWQEPLKKLAESLGLAFFSTPFDTTAVDHLEKIGVGFYKIAAYEATDHILLRRIAATGKPVIMSLGYATTVEADESVKLLRDFGTKDLALLHCVTYYSAALDPAQAYLATMLDIRDRYDAVCGFSDNNGGIEIPTLAVALGAAVIEKHLIPKNEDGGYDAQFSLNAESFAVMVRSIRDVEARKPDPLTLYQWSKEAIGTVLYGPRTEQERSNLLRFRRSLFVVKDIKTGEEFTSENVRSIRPSDGLETKYYWDILGKTAARDIERATPLSWDMIVR